VHQQPTTFVEFLLCFLVVVAAAAVAAAERTLAEVEAAVVAVDSFD